MHVLLGCLVAMAMAPSGDPRTIDPAANRPEIVAPGGAPATVQPTTTRSRKGEPTAEPKVEPRPGSAPSVASTEPDPSTQRCFPQRGRCWRLNAGGIVAATMGVGMLGTGIGFMLAPQFPVPDEPISNYSLRPPGVVLVATGAVTMVTGIVMIVAGQIAHGKVPRETAARGGSRRHARVRLGPGGLRW